IVSENRNGDRAVTGAPPRRTDSATRPFASGGGCREGACTASYSDRVKLFDYSELCMEGVSPPSATDPRVFRNDWTALAPPEVGSWTPGPTVSVVIPVRDDQRRLDRILACLARQTYPGHLMEVVVVDDHSATPPRLPDLRPERCRIEPAPPDGWGPGQARAHGSRLSTGEVL